jgi:DNA-binding NarL/FixJ family response regulator
VSRAVRLVVVDDHDLLRVGLRAFLSETADPAIDVVGEARSGEEAVELVEALRPDLLLMDLAMPGPGAWGGGVAADASALARRSPGVEAARRESAPRGFSGTEGGMPALGA